MYIDNKFVKKYDKMILDLIKKSRASPDIAEEIRARIYERIIESDNYDPEKGAMSTWVWRIAWSVISNESKRASRSQDALDHSIGLEAANTVIGVEDAGTVRDELDRIFAAARLSQRDEKIVKDFHLENYTAIEIARRMDISVHAVQKVLVRAMKALRDSVD